MASHLGMDSARYQKEYDEFLVKLKKFHNSKGTPFKRPPWLGGQYLDIYLLYKKVVSFGGWVKVTEDKRWKDVAECFNLPATCTNAAFALRQHYSRYLEAFERINFFGEDAEDVLVSQNARPHTPVGSGLLTGVSDYTSIVTTKDPAKNFERLILSLECGLPNEVDFAINVCMLLSNVSNSVFNLTKAPAVVEMLLAHTGVFCQESHSLKKVHKEWYQKSQRDFIKFWRETIQLKEMREYLCDPADAEHDMTTEVDEDDEECVDDQIFHPKKKMFCSKDVEAQRVFQVCMILFNFSFDETNAALLAAHPVCQRFLVMCVCSRLSCLQKIAWQTMSNLAEKMVLEAIESENTQMFFQMLHFSLRDKDRFHVISAMNVLGKVCLLEYNDEIIESGLEETAYEALVKVLTVPDVKLLIGSLETLYNLTGVGQVTSDYVANVVHSIDILVCLVTLEVESFGSEALAEIRLIENKTSVPVPVTPKPQANHIPTPQVVQSVPTPPTPTTPSASSRNEVDPDTFTQNWLQSTYEMNPSCSVSRIDLYADYLSICSKLARIGILNATAFNRIVKIVFPASQLRRVQSSSQLQYAILGIRRRASPVPVKSRLDFPDVPTTPTQQLPQQAHGPAVQRGYPGQQNISMPNRTPTPPTPTHQQVWSQAGQPHSQPLSRQTVPNLPSPLPHSVSRPASPILSPTHYQRPSMSSALQQGIKQPMAVQRPGFTGQATPQPQGQQSGWGTQQTNRPIASGQIALDTRQAQTLQAQIQQQRLAQAQHTGVTQQFRQRGNVPQSQGMAQPPISPGPLQRPTAPEQTALQRQQHQQQQAAFRQQQEQLYRQRQQQLQQMRQQMQSENQAAMHRRASRGQTPPPVSAVHTISRSLQAGIQPQIHRPSQAASQPQPIRPQQLPNPSVPASFSSPQQLQPSTRASNGLTQPVVMQQGTSPNVQSPSPYRSPYVAGPPNRPPQSPTAFQGQQQAPVAVPGQSQASHNQRQFPFGAQRPTFEPETHVQQPVVPLVNTTPQTQTQVYPSGIPGLVQAQKPLVSSLQGVHTPGQGMQMPSSLREQHTVQAPPQLTQHTPSGPPVQQQVNSRQNVVPANQSTVNSSSSSTPRINSGTGEAMVLIAKEERAEDVVTSELLKEAKEARIVMVENVSSTGNEPSGLKRRLENKVDSKAPVNEITRPTENPKDNHDLCIDSNGPTNFKAQNRSEVSNSNSGNTVENTRMNSQKCRPICLDNSSSVLGQYVDDATKKQEKHTSNENCVLSPTKKPRLDTKLPSLDSDILDSPTDHRHSDSPSSLVNGDIRLDSKNRFMDKLLGKDLHLPLNGVCGIDASDLDVGISSEEDPLSSRKSSPDLFDSCNNSDFDRFLEDNALFGDVLTGDLRVDSGDSTTKTEMSLEHSNSPSMQENGLTRNSVSGPVTANTRTVPFMDNTSTAGLQIPNAVVPEKGQVQPSSVNRTVVPSFNETVTNSRFNTPQQIAPNPVQRLSNPTHNPPMYSQMNGGHVSNGNVRTAPPHVSMPQAPPRTLAPNSPPYFDNRTKGVVTPGASVSESSLQHSQQLNTPPSPISPVMKPGIPVPGANPQAPPAYPAPLPTPVMEVHKPYRCQWELCTSSFDASKQLLSHIVSDHVTSNALVMACQWQGCTPVRRSRSSLLFHLQQKHLEPSTVPATGSTPAPPLPRPKQHAPIVQEPVQAQQAFIPQAFQFMARMLQALQVDEESPLTKTVRLTSALVLRNAAQYSAVARSMLRRHERRLVQVAMSNSEASRAVAACLAELSPHRKSPEREATFSWAFDS